MVSDIVENGGVFFHGYERPCSIVLFSFVVVVHPPNGRNAEMNFLEDHYHVVCLGVHGRHGPMDALLAIGVSKGILNVSACADTMTFNKLFDFVLFATDTCFVPQTLELSTSSSASIGLCRRVHLAAYVPLWARRTCQLIPCTLPVAPSNIPNVGARSKIRSF